MCLSFTDYPGRSRGATGLSFHFLSIFFFFFINAWQKDLLGPEVRGVGGRSSLDIFAWARGRDTMSWAGVLQSQPPSCGLVHSQASSRPLLPLGCAHQWAAYLNIVWALGPEPISCQGTVINRNALLIIIITLTCAFLVEKEGGGDGFFSFSLFLT